MLRAQLCSTNGPPWQTAIRMIIRALCTHTPPQRGGARRPGDGDQRGGRGYAIVDIDIALCAHAPRAKRVEQAGRRGGDKPAEGVTKRTS